MTERPRHIKPTLDERSWRREDGTAGRPAPDCVADYLMAIFGLHRSPCSCNGTGCAERLSLDGTHTIATRCHCGADPHAEALAEWVDG